MVLWFSETRTAAQGLWMTFKPGMELYLEANAIVEIKWGDQGGVCEGGQLPSSQDSHGQTVLTGAIKTALKTLKKLVYGRGLNLLWRSLTAAGFAGLFAVKNAAWGDARGMAPALNSYWRHGAARTARTYGASARRAFHCSRALPAGLQCNG